LSAVGLQFVIPPPIAKADVSVGFSEYFIPGAADDIRDVLNDLSPFTGDTFLNVITMPITTPNLTVYHGHWENGYLTGSDPETFRYPNRWAAGITPVLPAGPGGGSDPGLSENDG
jgi:hypothetical protein